MQTIHLLTPLPIDAAVLPGRLHKLLPQPACWQVRHRCHVRRPCLHDQPAMERHRLVLAISLSERACGQPVAGGGAARLRCVVRGATNHGAWLMPHGVWLMWCVAGRRGAAARFVQRHPATRNTICAVNCRAGAALLYGDKLGRRKELLLASGLYGERLAAGSCPLLTTGVGVQLTCRGCRGFSSAAGPPVAKLGRCSASHERASWLLSVFLTHICLVNRPMRPQAPPLSLSPWPPACRPSWLAGCCMERASVSPCMRRQLTLQVCKGSLAGRRGHVAPCSLRSRTCHALHCHALQPPFPCVQLPGQGCFHVLRSPCMHCNWPHARLALLQRRAPPGCGGCSSA